MLEELIVAASIGTGRKAPTFAAISLAIDDAVSALADESPEAKLLGTAAILTRYSICGRLPEPVTVAANAAEEESLPLCTRRAGELLGQVLLMPNNETKTHVIGEWLDQAARAGRRAPYRLLPALLDYAAARKAARHGITLAAGARGRWLMKLNPRWAFELDDREGPASAWSTGTRDQRLAVLKRLRETDAAGARDLVRSTWKEDTAEDRSLFVTAMHVALGDEDEPFLESCLDDRSKQVRMAAAELLARLPRSAYVRRMIDRAAPLLKYTPSKRGGLLKKAVPAAVEVVLPPAEFAADWARDGIIEKPEGKIGRRQWWLQQILAAVPPGHWSTQWDLPAAQCIAAANGEFADVVLAAWHEAARRHPDPIWIAALLLAAAKGGRGPVSVDLLNQLPQNVRQALACELLESPRMTAEIIMPWLRSMDFSLDRHSTIALFGKIEQHLDEHAAGTSYFVNLILQAAALHIPPNLHDTLSERCTGEKWTPVRKALDEFFQNLLIRRDIQREFNP